MFGPLSEGRGKKGLIARHDSVVRTLMAACRAGAVHGTREGLYLPGLLPAEGQSEAARLNRTDITLPGVGKHGSNLMIDVTVGDPWIASGTGEYLRVGGAVEHVEKKKREKFAQVRSHAPGGRIPGNPELRAFGMDITGSWGKEAIATWKQIKLQVEPDHRENWVRIWRPRINAILLRTVANQYVSQAQGSHRGTGMIGPSAEAVRDFDRALLAH